MRFIVKERLVQKKGHRGLVSKGFYVFDSKKAEKASPLYQTLKHANGHCDRLEESK